MRPQTVVFVEPPYDTRPDVLWGLAKTLAGEPRFLGPVARYIRVGLREWLAVDPARGSEALAS